jgi:hypothetical protein
MNNTKYLVLTVFAVLILALGCSQDSGLNPSTESGTAPLMAPTTWAYIGDFVWHDMNQDGIQDPGEPGVPGVTVHLYDCWDILLESTVTDADGLYLFTTEWDRDYYIMFDLPSGWTVSPQDQGADDAVDSDVDAATGKTVCTFLEAYEEDRTWDAGIYTEDPPDSGCSHTLGYWKNWDGYGPQPDMVTQYLPIWLGDPAGTKSLPVTTAAISTDVLEMKTYGNPSNGITKLYAQMLAAKLSVADGASDDDIDDAIADADAFLAENDHTDWQGLSRADKNMVLDWMETFDKYNNGIIGPGHCDDMEEPEDKRAIK